MMPAESLLRNPSAVDSMLLEKVPSKRGLTIRTTMVVTLRNHSKNHNYLTEHRQCLRAGQAHTDMRRECQWPNHPRERLGGITRGADLCKDGQRTGKMQPHGASVCGHHQTMHAAETSHPQQTENCSVSCIPADSSKVPQMPRRIVQASDRVAKPPLCIHQYLALAIILHWSSSSGISQLQPTWCTIPGQSLACCCLPKVS